MDYPKEFFDFVIDNFSVCHNKRECIEEIYKRIFNILKSGGKLLVANFTTKTTGDSLGDAIEENTRTNISSGPFVGKGVTHFSSKVEITSIIEALITIASKP